ncbi:MAG: methylmalonyl Co-A mutase-associated GTPase MeaB [bacterium]|nr:methylmalonyl Co-A mutase-associated GTPase MeaB [bacterium]
MDLASRLRAGDAAALARAITLVENSDAGARRLLSELYPHTGRARVIGITGPPGVGKSTLTDQLAVEFRSEGGLVGVVAVDPTSPFTGGAILGDRVRMTRGAGDPGVFIRSLATRGQLGGLSRATGDVIKLMDAGGRDVILVETVGAGQAEIDIMHYAHSTLVVVAPGLGDEIQAIKAGIMEIGHVFVVNKADRDGADRTAAELEMMLEMAPDRDPGAWRPPVIRTVARDGSGVSEVRRQADAHWAYLKREGGLEEGRRRRAASELAAMAGSLAERHLLEWARISGAWNRVLDQVTERQVDPYGGAEVLFREYREAALLSRTPGNAGGREEL